MTEEWRDIPGYGGLYQASSLGRIRRAVPYNNTKPGGVLSPCVHKNGRLYVSLSMGGTKQRKSVSRLVAAAFLGPCPDGLTVNHKDGNKKNDIPDNLEYMTARENLLHGEKMGLHAFGARNSQAKLTDPDVVSILAMLDRGEKRRYVASIYGVSKDTIDQIRSGKAWKHIKRTA